MEDNYKMGNLDNFEGKLCGGHMGELAALCILWQLIIPWKERSCGGRQASVMIKHDICSGENQK